MMGVLAPNEGAVHIDDLDLQEFAASSIRRQASYLPAANTAFRVLEGLHRPSYAFCRHANACVDHAKMKAITLVDLC